MKSKRVRGAFRNVSLTDPEDLAIFDFMDQNHIQDGYQHANYYAIREALHAAKKQRKRGILARLFEPTGWPVVRLFIGGQEKNSPALEIATLFMDNEQQAEKLYHFLHEQSGIAYRAEREYVDDYPF